jgi:hypothetical protein
MTDTTALDYSKDVAKDIEEQYAVDGFDVYEWLEDILDVRRTYNSTGQLYSVDLLVAFGGPTTWLTVRDSDYVDVETTWYSEPAKASAYVPGFGAEVLEAFDSWSITR